MNKCRWCDEVLNDAGYAPCDEECSFDDTCFCDEWCAKYEDEYWNGPSDRHLLGEVWRGNEYASYQAEQQLEAQKLK